MGGDGRAARAGGGRRPPPRRIAVRKNGKITGKQDPGRAVQWRRERRVASLALGVTLLLAVAACDDDPVTPRAHDARRPAGALAQQHLLDPAIDQSDTYLVTDATTQTTTTVQYSAP